MANSVQRVVDRVCEEPVGGNFGRGGFLGIVVDFFGVGWNIFRMKLEGLSFRDRLDILLEKRSSPDVARDSRAMI